MVHILLNDEGLEVNSREIPNVTSLCIESIHVNIPNYTILVTTITIDPPPMQGLMPDDRTLEEVQQVESLIEAARAKEELK